MLLAPFLLALSFGVHRSVYWHVDASAPCGIGNGSASQPFCTVEEAVNAAASGDQILIAPGSYAENLIYAKDLTFVGTAGLEATTLTTAQPGYVFGPQNGTTTVLRGLTIEGAEFGGVVLNSSTPARLELWNCRVWKNKNIGSIADGGGLYARNADVLLVDTLVLQNVCDPNPTSPFPDAYGAGMSVGGGSLTLVRCTVADNVVQSRDYANGGGIDVGGADVVIQDSIIERNVVSGFQPLRGGGIHASGGGALSVQRSVIRNNFARDGSGIWASGPIALEDVELTNNRASSTGASLVVFGYSATMRNATIVSSSGTSLVDVDLFASIDVESSILWSSLPTMKAFTGDPSALAASVVDHSDVLGGWSGVGTGNIDCDPAFRNSAAGNVRLLESSPCIDAGDPSFSSTAKDAGGIGRLLDGDLDRIPVVDMGAHELTNLTLEVTGSLTPGATITLSLSGSPSLTSTHVAIATQPSPGLFIPPFGSLYFDPSSPLVTVAMGPSPASASFVVPPMTCGMTAVFQAIGFGAPLPPKPGKRPGNVSNAVTLFGNPGCSTGER